MFKKIFIGAKKSYKTFMEGKLSKFALSLLAYGAVINLPFHVFLNSSYNPLTIASYGILFYFISEELPKLLFKLRGRR